MKREELESFVFMLYCEKIIMTPGSSLTIPIKKLNRIGKYINETFHTRHNVYETSEFITKWYHFLKKHPSVFTVADRATLNVPLEEFVKTYPYLLS